MYCPGFWVLVIALPWMAIGAKRYEHPGPAGPGACTSCHDTASAPMVSAHQGQLLRADKCTSCHDPAGSNTPKLIYDIQHGPFAGRHCDECHAEPEGGRIRINGGNVKDLCLTCHVVIGNKLAESKSGHSAQSCTACHTPHASNFRPHLKTDRQSLCRSCHSEPPADARFSH